LTRHPCENRLAVKTLTVFLFLMVVWSGVWLVKDMLDRRFHELTSGRGAALFWLAAKVIVWILPACWLIHISGRSIRDVANLSAWRSWTCWGTGIGLLISATAIIPKWIHGVSFLPDRLDYAAFNVLVISPLFEEYLIRGALLGNLIPAIGLARANMIAAFCFVLLHLPGWCMMGSLHTKLAQPLGGAFSVFLLGLCFGVATQKGRSFLGGSIAHFFNNLTA